MTPTLSRRALFSSILGKLKTQDTTDPLFAKYSRKIFRGRKYQQATNPNATDAQARDLNRVAPVSSGLTPYLGPWSKIEALHLLRRTNFGFKKTDVDSLAAMTFNTAVDTILTISAAPAPQPLNYILGTDENGLAYGQPWPDDAITSASYATGGVTNNARINSLRYWGIGNLCNQDISIKEKMSLFWYHFIPIDYETVRNGNATYTITNSARICHKYLKYFSDNATGNFKTLIRNISTQPAMMLYLNNQVNSVTSPDENFAREVMELFTLGKDPGSNYTQADVVQAAKLLTGWRIQNLNTINPSTGFVATAHDTSTKQFSAFFNNTAIPNSGAAELDLFIDMIFSKQQVVSQYICRKLYRYFVYYDIDATTETNIIIPLAQTFVANNWNIAPVLAQLLKSQHFFDMANRGVYIKSPYDLVIGTLRTFNMNYNVSDASNASAQYLLWKSFNDTLGGLEQSQGRIPNVAGWPAFYQNPSFHEYWINSSTIQKRGLFLTAVFNGFNNTNNGLTTRIEVDVIAWVQQFSSAIIEDPNTLVQECINYLLPIDLSTQVKNTLKVQNLLSNQTSDYYWTGAWLNYANNPTNATNIAAVKTRLKALLVTITQFAEYQLM